MINCSINNFGPKILTMEASDLAMAQTPCEDSCRYFQYPSPTHPTHLVGFLHKQYQGYIKCIYNISNINPNISNAITLYQSSFQYPSPTHPTHLVGFLHKHYTGFIKCISNISNVNPNISSYISPQTIWEIYQMFSQLLYIIYYIKCKSKIYKI